MEILYNKIYLFYYAYLYYVYILANSMLNVTWLNYDFYSLDFNFLIPPSLLGHWHVGVRLLQRVLPADCGHVPPELLRRRKTNLSLRAEREGLCLCSCSTASPTQGQLISTRREGRFVFVFLLNCFADAWPTYLYAPRGRVSSIHLNNAKFYLQYLIKI